MENTVLAKFKAGQQVIGTITHMKSPTAVEALGAAGLDYVMMDMEHSPTDLSEVHSCIIAANAAGITPFVRVSDASRSSVLRVLDIGAMGVIVPCIETVDQVRDLIQHAKFQPTGNRGYCMTRDGLWGTDHSYENGLTQYMNCANNSSMLIPQCETTGCLEHIEEITAMDGVDGILIGPYDLSIAMGIDGQFQHPEFEAAVKRILKACKANGKMSIIFVGNEADAARRKAEGFDNIMMGLDVLSLISLYSGIVSRFHQ